MSRQKTKPLLDELQELDYTANRVVDTLAVAGVMIVFIALILWLF